MTGDYPALAGSELAEELRGLLIGEGLTEGVNLHLRERDGQVRVQLMAVDLGKLGLLLAVLSDPAELADPLSLSSRVASGRNDGAQDRWRYGLMACRYPVNGEIVFLADVRLPASDLPEVIWRLRQAPPSRSG
jgi:hypothetical protein